MYEAVNCPGEAESLLIKDMSPDAVLSTSAIRLAFVWSATPFAARAESLKAATSTVSELPVMAPLFAVNITEPDVVSAIIGE